MFLCALEDLDQARVEKESLQGEIEIDLLQTRLAETDAGERKEKK